MPTPLTDADKVLRNDTGKSIATKLDNIAAALSRRPWAQEGIIAEAYDNTDIYAVGDYAIYEHSLWRCTTAVTVAENFDVNKWTEVQLADDVKGKANTSDVTSALANKADVSALNNKMDKADPTGSGSLSINRKANTTIGTNSVAVGNNTTASGNFSFAEGSNTVASAYNAHAEGLSTEANDSAAHAEGIETLASYAAHAEGYWTEAIGDSSHAEGMSAIASGRYSHAEGDTTTASGYAAHAEGKNTTASEEATHAEGSGTTASAEQAHAEGYYSVASGYYSHAQNMGTIAAKRSQNVFGEYNIAETGGNSYSRGTYVEIVGNGTTNNDRSNARTLDWSGNEMIAGDLTFNGSTSLTTALGAKANSSDVYTKQQVDTKLATLRGNIASDYSASSTYDEGDCVMYDGVLYQCNTDITIAEAWTPAHWTQVKVTEISGGGGGGASWTDVTGTLEAGQTLIVLQNASITTNSTIEVFTEDGTEWNDINITAGRVMITFDKQITNLGVKVRVT